MKNILQSFVLISFLIFISSCCKTREITKIETVQLPPDTDTVFIERTVTVPEIHSEPVFMDLNSICDSLMKGKLIPQKRISTGTGNNQRKITGTAEIDTAGILKMYCREDEFKLKIDSLEQLNIKMKELTRETVEKVIQKPLFNLYKYSAFIFGILFLLLLIYSLKKGK